ncbi:MAG TPA: hypothetical protein VF149_01430, partial [Bacillales bacterium]
MTGTFIQPALMSANNAKANLNGSVGSGANGKSVGENSLFAGTLENILAKDVKLGTKVPPDLAKLLEKLV